MSSPMKTFVTDDGRKFLIPGTLQRETRIEIGELYHCECHERMGNDFYFLPIAACLRKDKTCTNPKGQALS